MMEANPRMDEVLTRFDEQMRRRPSWDGVERGDRVTRVVGTGWNGVVWSDLDASSADAVIAGEIERFAGQGEWEWKLYSYDHPPDLAERLLAAGFEAEDAETLLVATVADLPLESALPDGVELHPVMDDVGVEAFLEVHAAVFGGYRGALGTALREDLRAGKVAAVVAWAGDRPISSGRIEFNEGTDFASLYGGSTVINSRRRGIFRAVIAHRAALAAARGYRYLQTDASEDSRPILERLGFRKLATTTPFVHT